MAARWRRATRRRRRAVMRTACAMPDRLMITARSPTTTTTPPSTLVRNALVDRRTISKLEYTYLTSLFVRSNARALTVKSFARCRRVDRPQPVGRRSNGPAPTDKELPIYNCSSLHAAAMPPPSAIGTAQMKCALLFLSSHLLAYFGYHITLCGTESDISKRRPLFVRTVPKTAAIRKSSRARKYVENGMHTSVPVGV
uniref:Uncharacterized protein n=1 Tax=Plectus sambesii TaxID=2011161 RepID=A0A914X915_9BILA